MNRDEIKTVFQTIENIRHEIGCARLMIPESVKSEWANRPLVTADSLLHQAEQTLLDANKWLGYFALHASEATANEHSA